MRHVPFAMLIALFAATLSSNADAGEKSDSKVKATATATKIDADGKQTVTITLNIDNGWHLYANPVNHNNDDFNVNKTIVKIAAKEKVNFTVKYPAGTTKIDMKDKYDIYTGNIKIQADVVRTKGDTSPLEINITVNACDSDNCLPKATVKLTVP